MNAELTEGNTLPALPAPTFFGGMLFRVVPVRGQDGVIHTDIKNWTG